MSRALTKEDDAGEELPESCANEGSGSIKAQPVIAEVFTKSRRVISKFVCPSASDFGPEVVMASLIWFIPLRSIHRKWANNTCPRANRHGGRANTLANRIWR